MNKDVKIYDFKKPQRYSSDNMRFLSVVSEEFCKNINLFLAYELKKHQIYCKVEKIEQTNYDEFMKLINTESVIVEHAIQPLVQDLIFQIDKPIALTLIDLMLGGDGVFDNYKRELTEIDKQLIFQTSSQFLSRMYVVESCTHRDVLRVHTNAGASKKYPISESVLIAHMKMMYGDKEIGKMRFCEPYSCMEPILEYLETKKLFRSKNLEYDFEFTNTIYNNVCGAKTDLLARLGKTSISVEELLNLKVGDAIKLDSKVNGDIELDVAGARVFTCKPGLIKKRNGVIVTDSIKKGV
ncbi:flagellar motor switch protein FliM [Romboutsia lituseburensis]|uniref:Flagellar motor switch protein FliM n=1 Tax=Romboutsia lituseburensis DSM 797 TaxID=1121325 RepID=A0A1G9PDC3_9FIRM|nr:FliM/FliN family flagellar motor switch protein [Romboutsia lituseburensis]CEH33321.1 Flagellar motor switch protein FliM [Romboutsia lituseburensis]SDL96227.1 Type III flagellar switch regulator (C-ring) FliN C-term [Romboutsia lituseburensis DSM 797]